MIHSLLFNADGKTLFSRDLLGTVQLWDMASRKIIATVGTGIRLLMLSPDGKTLFTVSDDNIYLWDVARRKRTATLERDQEKEKQFRYLALTIDGKTAAAISGADRISPGNTIVIWEVASHKRIARLEEDQEAYWLLFSPDGKIVTTHVRSSPGSRDNVHV